MPRSDGKITSPELNARWQHDLINCKAKSPEKNGGNRLLLVCVDIFNWFLYTELLQTKEAEEVVEAFQRALRRARNRAIKGESSSEGTPKEVSTDTGAEFKGPFSEMLEKQGISQRFKESINSLAVVDGAIRTIKIMIAKEMVDTESESWAKAVPLAVKAYNSNSHSALMNSAPEDVKGTPVLQYELEKQSGFDVASNSNINEKGRIDKLRALGAFRILLPRSTWNRAGQPRYSEKVYEFLHIYGQDVKATDGATAPIKHVMPVPLGSGDVKIPRELRAGRPIRDEGARAALHPFATALHGFLGPDGGLTLQGAGTKLRAIPGFSEAMAAQKITGIGAWHRFLQKTGTLSRICSGGQSPQGVRAASLEWAHALRRGVQNLTDDLRVGCVDHEAKA